MASPAGAPSPPACLPWACPLLLPEPARTSVCYWLVRRGGGVRCLPAKRLPPRLWSVVNISPSIHPQISRQLQSPRRRISQALPLQTPSPSFQPRPHLQGPENEVSPPDGSLSLRARPGWVREGGRQGDCAVGDPIRSPPGQAASGFCPSSCRSK